MNNQRVDSFSPRWAYLDTALRASLSLAGGTGATAAATLGLSPRMGFVFGGFQGAIGSAIACWASAFFGKSAPLNYVCGVLGGTAAGYQISVYPEGLSFLGVQFGFSLATACLVAAGIACWLRSPRREPQGEVVGFEVVNGVVRVRLVIAPSGNRGEIGVGEMA